MHNDGVLINVSVPRLLEPPAQSFFLFGPRGTGKSTWLKTALPSAVRIDLLDESLFQELLVQPGLLAQMLQKMPPGAWVVIDEVQRLPNLLNEVHRAIEERRLKFALSGSSTRKLKRAGVNLLGGRAERLTMYPFVPQELKEHFGLEDALRWGTLPIVLASPNPEKALAAYTQLYVREEIQAEALVRNLSAFARFLPVAALFHAQVLNISSLARDAAVQRNTVNDYIQILEDTLLAWRLPAFEARLRVRERRHPKLYWVDAGLVRALKRQLGDVAEEERGPLFEGLVAMMLREHLERVGDIDALSYWASAHVEVDFILRRRKTLVAIEVKAATRLRDAELTGLRAVAELKEVRRRVFVYRGTRSFRTDDGIEVMSFGDFSRELASGALMSTR